MKIALGFAKAQTFWLHFVTSGAIFSKWRRKTKDFKSIEQGYTEGTFSLPFKIPTLCLVGASPKPQKAKAKAKAKMALASLVSSQKQKHTIVKIFMKSDAKKAVFQRVESRTFIVSLVDTR